MTLALSSHLLRLASRTAGGGGGGGNGGGGNGTAAAAAAAGVALAPLMGALADACESKGWRFSKRRCPVAT
jgi:hypothetical protein